MTRTGLLMEGLDSIIPQLDVLSALNYSCAMLSADNNMLISHALLLLGLLVGIPLVTVAIVRAALKGKPHNFGRDMYGLVFVLSCAGFLFLGTYAQRMAADVRTWQYVLQTVLMGLVELLFGVAAGCMISVFVCKRRLSTQKSE